MVIRLKDPDDWKAFRRRLAFEEDGGNDPLRMAVGATEDQSRFLPFVDVSWILN